MNTWWMVLQSNYMEHKILHKTGRQPEGLVLDGLSSLISSFRMDFFESALLGGIRTYFMLDISCSATNWNTYHTRKSGSKKEKCLCWEMEEEEMEEEKHYIILLHHFPLSWSFHIPQLVVATSSYLMANGRTNHDAVCLVHDLANCDLFSEWMHIEPPTQCLMTQIAPYITCYISKKTT